MNRPKRCALETFLLVRIVESLQLCIEKVTYLRYRVSIDTLRVLEPYAVKVASTVLRRERRGNPPDLSDRRPLVASMASASKSDYQPQ